MRNCQYITWQLGVQMHLNEIIVSHYQLNTWATRKGLSYTPRTDEYTIATSVSEQ